MPDKMMKKIQSTTTPAYDGVAKRKLQRARSGATTIEYTMLIVVIATGLILAANALGVGSANVFNRVSAELSVGSGSSGDPAASPGSSGKQDKKDKKGKKKK